MTNLINKSNHPVEVKKVRVRLWTLRSEIEAAISKRIKEEGHNEDGPVDISDIQAYYNKYLNPDEAKKDEKQDEGNQNLDPSGNPMDDDANEMMAAMQGGGDSEPETEEKTEEEVKASEENTEAGAEEKSEEASAEDDEAARLAAEMMAGQMGGEEKKEETSAEDDEAARLAAEMLDGQGVTNDSSDSQEKETKEDKNDKEKQKEKKVRGPFERIVPDESKIVEGEVLLSDVLMDQIMIFADNTFLLGQNIIIEFLVTKAFKVSAELVISQNVGRNSKIIKNQKLPYRLQAVLKFQFPLERHNLREFLKSIEPVIPSPPKKVKKADDDGDDDFDDLGF